MLERPCGWCGAEVLVAVRLPDGRQLQRSPGRGSRVYCCVSHSQMASRKRRAEGG